MLETSAAPVASRILRPGARLGRYTIVDRIGCGGMAELYLARADGLGGFEKALALKVMHAHLMQQPSAVRMFLREARLAASLEHPNIVQVHDVGVFDGEHVLVMEYVHGRDVSQILGRLPEGEPLSLGCALRIIVDVAAALDYVHTKTDGEGNPLGLVHRDVSPANVLVGFHGAVRLADFGIAKINAHGSTTQTGALKGKFGYMSPEQSMGQSIDARSDVFALGVLLYEVTTGRRAFAGESAFAIMNRVIEGAYVHPRELVLGYPESLASIVERALAVDPDDRYPSVRAMLVDIESYVVSAGVSIERRSLTETMRSLFGDPSYPNLSAVMPREIAAVTSIETSSDDLHRPSRGRRGRAQLGTIAVTALIVGLAAGWYAGTDVRSGQEETTSPAAVVEPLPSPEPSAPAVQVHTALIPVPLDTKEDAGEPVVPLGTKEEAGEVPAKAVASKRTPATSDRRKRQRSRAKRRRAETSSPTDPPSPARDPLDSMFPRSMQ